VEKSIWENRIRKNTNKENLGLCYRLQKGRIYSLSKDEREEAKNFVNDQLRKGYIRLSKSLQILPVSQMATY